MRRAFDSFEEESGSDRHYEQGVEPIESLVADEVLTLFLETKVDDYFHAMHYLVTESLDGFADLALDANLLLSEIMKGIERTDSIRQHHSRYLTSPVIQSLYDRGDNEFILRYLDCTKVISVGTDLKGEHDRPLRLMCQAPDGTPQDGNESIGAHAQYLELRYQGKGAKQIGFDARDCVFHLDDSPSTLGNSTDCVYLLADASAESRLQRVDGSLFNQDHYWLYTKSGDSIGVPLDFADRGNKLYVPDGSRSWKEVRP